MNSLIERSIPCSTRERSLFVIAGNSGLRVWNRSGIRAKPGQRRAESAEVPCTFPVIRESGQETSSREPPLRHLVGCAFRGFLVRARPVLKVPAIPRGSRSSRGVVRRETGGAGPRRWSLREPIDRCARGAAAMKRASAPSRPIRKSISARMLRRELERRPSALRRREDPPCWDDLESSLRAVLRARGAVRLRLPLPAHGDRGLLCPVVCAGR
jgi:hypothetical protein